MMSGVLPTGKFEGRQQLRGERAMVAVFADHAPPPKLEGIVEVVDIEDLGPAKRPQISPRPLAYTPARGRALRAYHARTALLRHDSSLKIENTTCSTAIMIECALQTRSWNTNDIAATSNATLDAARPASRL